MHLRLRKFVMQIRCNLYSFGRRARALVAVACVAQALFRNIAILPIYCRSRGWPSPVSVIVDKRETR